MEMRSLFRLNRYLSCSSVLSVILVALAVSGCASTKVKMYPGKEVASNQQATIRTGPLSSSLTTMQIVRVDGKDTADFFAFLFHGGQRAGEVYVLPGKHNILVEMHLAFTYAMADLWLVAEPGETYVIKYLSKGYRVRIWIENERTGRPVGGVTGSDDEPK